ncbi:MAG TPA: hypothetical protein PK331_03675 [Gordonia sp. (in: high G+C Gram-positive bacteria)]|uniref:hypothetical protein n=1 Tax=unclassified Gordonia (in: high G+C Gram-positive bacteria) TaxID=2657482 RepID=UPI000FAC8DDB|nr:MULTISPECIES: hypothetical protein [unclassified Gordonia (in: high G+C Gram-positive bacteria)]RUP38649.1 MAG: hypothetical protein EKK60_09440 [Gordonia sp. (in: high G+C Gram-positive bacteria)]HNP56328.1 hypothetical protein [Gordonia sp. (in: high G+C Gram-positive bacteria)]HRC50012.1 hypothetical protein [Gordonia sp. (in: high G+C Gram-positive bacteria)]
MATFDDDELERYYRRIEARTESARADEGHREQRSAAPRRKKLIRGGPDRDRTSGESSATCPTPDKEGHADPDAAWLAVAVLRAGRIRTPELDVYRCRCGLWHITSRGQGHIVSRGQD